MIVLENLAEFFPSFMLKQFILFAEKFQKMENNGTLCLNNKLYV